MLIAAAAAAGALAVLVARRPPRGLGAVGPARRGPEMAVVVAVVVGVAMRSRPMLLLALAGAGYAARELWHQRRRRIHRRRCEREVATLAFGLAAELRAGQPPPHALRAAAGQLHMLAPDLLRWADVADRGGDLAAEFRALAARPGCGRLRAVGAVWAVTASTGSRVADVLDSVGDAIEAEEQAADELAALMAGPRATVVVLALLPVAGIAIATAVGLHPLPVLVHRPVGRLLLAAAGALDLVGLLLMRRLALPQAQP